MDLCPSAGAIRSRDFVARKSLERPNEFLLNEHYGTEQDSPPIENSLRSLLPVS